MGNLFKAIGVVSVIVLSYELGHKRGFVDGAISMEIYTHGSMKDLQNKLKDVNAAALHKAYEAGYKEGSKNESNN